LQPGEHGNWRALQAAENTTQSSSLITVNICHGCSNSKQTLALRQASEESSNERRV